MNFTKWWGVIACLYFGYSLSGNAQIRCGTEPLSPLEKAEFGKLLTKSHKNLRRSDYAIKVNAVIFQNEGTPNNFGEEEVRELLSNTNQYFKNIGIQFILENDSVRQIANNKYQSFLTKNEIQMRSEYDSHNAVNIYFVKSITSPDGTLLNGYSSLPSYKSGSNRLIFSYQNNHPEDFKILKEKTFLHEMGHYFGLLHTFQNSADPDISKRELVTRGVNSNCSFTGDELCDTPSDPFERLENISALNCSQPYPADLVDANGQNYDLFFSNIMSYHLGCGNEFTPQQYQRMEASLGIRLSPNAEYRLSPIEDQNFISIVLPKKPVYCAGQAVTLKMETMGSFDPENVFIAEITNANGENFQKIEAQFLEDSVKIDLPNSLPPGQNYHFRISASHPFLTSFLSQGFEIKKATKIKLSSSKSAINLGEQVEMKVKSTSGGPWSFTLSNGNHFENLIKTEIAFQIRPEENSTYQLQTASYLCGIEIDTAKVYIQVVPPAINISDNFTTNICKNSIIKMPTSGLIIENISHYKIILEGHLKTYKIIPSISAFTLNFVLPQEVRENESYKLKIVGIGLGDFSLAKEVSVFSKPEQPKIISPVKYCFNSISEPLLAEGDSLKWYYSETDNAFFKSITPKTTEEGVSFYYVAQVSEKGCESEKGKIEVRVNPPVTANLSGNSTINFGDSTRLRIDLTGEAPWYIELKDGTSILAETPSLVYYVKPAESTTYTLKQVNNSCGNGFISGEANVTVMQPLSIFEKNNELKIFPSPARNHLDIDIKQNLDEIYKVQVVENSGKVILNKMLPFDKGLGRIQLPNLSPGVYIIKLWTQEDTFIKKLVVQ